MTTRREDAQLVVDVEDEGAGFDSAILELRSNRGFGLFSVSDQIGRLGGKMELVSESGAGTCVTLRVPFAALASRPEGGEP